MVNEKWMKMKDLHNFVLAFKDDDLYFQVINTSNNHTEKYASNISVQSFISISTTHLSIINITIYLVPNLYGVF